MPGVPKRPRRRSYQTGASLPALTDEYRPIPLGRDEVGEPDGQVRALAVLVRNRADTPIYVKEGPEAIDEMEIARGEDYRIWEPNGVNAIRLKGENGGEKAEIRTLEAHNDFNLTDRIEAFARSLAHFVGTATRDTRITGQDVDISIDDAGGISVTGAVDANISGSDIDMPVTGNVAIDDITGQTTDLDIAGNVVVDDISAVSTQFDGDITGQANFDIRSFNREGFTTTRFLRETNVSYDTFHEWTLYDPASFDGSIESFQVRVYADDHDNDAENFDDVGAILTIDTGDGSGYQVASPQRAHSTLQASSHPSGDVTVGRNSSTRECVYTFNPDPGVYFEQGDSVRFVIQHMNDTTPSRFPESAGDYNLEITVTINQRERL